MTEQTDPTPTVMEADSAAAEAAIESTSGDPVGTPWWMRTPTADPAGDPAGGRPRPTSPASAEARGAAPRATAAVTGWVPDGGLSRALADERRRLLSERDEIETRRRRIEEQIEAVDARIGHIDALLSGDPVTGPPVELPRIGRPRADAA